MADERLDDLVAELAAEQAVVADAVRDLPADDWFRPTPARFWDVRDTIAHLADTDEMAVDTVVGGPHSLGNCIAEAASGEDVTFRGVMRGRRLPGDEVLAWWERASRAEREVLAAADPDVRVPWGLGMRPASFVKARLMETWAHGLDVLTAVGVESRDTPRLRHVAWLATRALPYAFTVAGREPPRSPLRVDLVGPDGERWSFGPDDAPDRITGPVGEYCRLFVQRISRADAPNLVATGDGATAALGVARAYL